MQFLPLPLTGLARSYVRSWTRAHHPADPASRETRPFPAKSSTTSHARLAKGGGVFIQEASSRIDKNASGFQAVHIQGKQPCSIPCAVQASFGAPSCISILNTRSSSSDASIAQLGVARRTRAAKRLEAPNLQWHANFMPTAGAQCMKPAIRTCLARFTIYWPGYIGMYIYICIYGPIHIYVYTA